MNMRSVVLFFLTLTPLSSLAQFEGVVESHNMTVDELGVPRQYTITMWFKRDRVRIQSSASGDAPPTTMIYRTDRKIIWMINDEEHTFYEILRDDSQSGEHSHYRAEAGDRPVVNRTGKVRKILGYRCEQVVIRRDNVDTEIWGTTALRLLASTAVKVLGPSEQDPGGDVTERLNSLGLYALSSLTKIEGMLVESQETTKIETREIAAELFELPAGYRKVDMSNPN